MPGAFRDLLGQQGGGHGPGLDPLADFRQVLLGHGVLPLDHQLIEGHAEDPSERHLEPAADGVLGDGADRFVAPPLTDVRDQSVPKLVGKHLQEVVRGRELAFNGAVAEPHRRLGVDRTEREILGHPFAKPERGIGAQDALDPGTASAARPDVELELVGHFVREDMLVVGIGAGERKGIPMPQEVGETAGAFVDVPATQVGLLEVAVRGIQNDRLSVLELMVEDSRKPGV